jgi:hypothetical protein
MSLEELQSVPYEEVLYSYDFTIEHLKGMQNPGDRPSSKPHYEIYFEILPAMILGTLAATTLSE